MADQSTSSPSRGDTTAITGVNVPPSHAKSPLHRRKISYGGDASKRKAAKQPSPHHGVRRSPQQRRQRPARVSTDSSVAAAASFNPDSPSLTTLQPPDVAVITQTQSSSPKKKKSKKKKKKPNQPKPAAATNAATSTRASTTKGASTNNNTKKKAPIPTFQQRINSIHNNQFHRFARKDLFKSKEVDLDIEAFEAWERKFTEQQRVCFQRRQVSHATRVESSGRGLRSSTRDEMMYDDEALRVETTDIRRLTRYPFEKLLLLEEDAPMVVYFRNDTDVLNKLYKGKPQEAAVEQKKLGIAGQIESINGSKFLCLRARMYTARLHQEINAGGIRKEKLEELFKQKQGFTIEFTGTTTRQVFSWKSTIERAEDLFFFSRPLDNVPRFNLLFQVGRAKPDYLRSIYRGIARETVGDVRMSQALSLEFHRRLSQVKQAEVVREKRIDKLLSFDEVKTVWTCPKSGKEKVMNMTEALFRSFDRLCRRRFLTSVVELNDFNRPIVSMEIFDDYVVAAARAMPRLWNHTKDCRGCYFAASELVGIAYEEASTILAHAFVSEKSIPLREKHSAESTANYVCYLSREFASWIGSLFDSDDNWLKTNAMFVVMAKDFFRFVDSYRCGDAISVELGYQRFVSVWKALGQCRYEERHWRQQEELFLRHPFRRLEEVRRSRMSNPYSAATGKGMLAMDEALELSNRFYAGFPDVRTMEAFVRQANYIGMAKLSKRFMEAVQAMKSDNGLKVYKSGKSPKRIAERAMVREIFIKLGTGTYVSGRTFNDRYVSSTILPTATKLSTKLVEVSTTTKNGKEQIHESAFQFLSSIAQVLDDVAIASHVEEDDVPLEELVSNDTSNDITPTNANDDALEAQTAMMDDDANRCAVEVVDEPVNDDTRKSDNAISKKLGYNRFMIESVWSAGRERIAKSNVKKVRGDARRRMLRKLSINKAVAVEVKKRASIRGTGFKEEKEVQMTTWTVKAMQLCPDMY